MAALTGQLFIDNLTKFLVKANLTGAAQAWYSFWPESGQSNFEFVFNSLLPTGQAFVQKVSRAQMTNLGSGYVSGEIPNVVFTSLDNGTYASGVAVMSANPIIPPNLIQNGDFANLQTGWYNVSLSQIAFNGSTWSFSGNKLTTYNTLFFTPNELEIHPNSGSTIHTGTLLGDYLTGYFDITYVSGSSTPGYVTVSNGTSDIDILISGTGRYTFITPDTELLYFTLVCNYQNGYSIDNIYAATGFYEAALNTNLSRVWPISGAGTSLIQNGDFSSRSGWYLNSIQAATSGNRHVFTGNQLLFHNSDLVESFTFLFQPNSGALSISGPTWVQGQFDIIATGVIGIDSGNFLEIANMGLPDVDRIISIDRTGTISFGFYIESGETYSPALNVTVGINTSWIMDNFLMWTGEIGDEVINNSQIVSCNAAGCITEKIVPTIDLSNNRFQITGGIRGIALSDGQGVASPPAALTIRTASDGFSGDFTFAFRHLFRNQDAGHIYNQLRIADFPHFGIEIRSNKYALVNTDSSTVIQTNVEISTGWRTIVVVSQKLPGGQNFGIISIDGDMYSGGVGVLRRSPNLTTFSGTTDWTLYGVAVDEIYEWARALTINEIAYFGSYYYPFHTSSSSSYFVSGITITNQGQNYITAPTITINAPTGGGIQAQALAILGPETGKIYAESLPGLSVGGTNYLVTGMTSGTGTLLSGNNDFLRVGNTVNFEDWTLFLNFSPSGSVRGTSRVLVSTMDYTNQQSGLIIGINDSNRLFFEYIDSTHPSGSCRRVKVHNEELGKKNVIALSQDNSHQTLTICIHDLADHDTRSRSYFMKGYNNSNIIYIGGFPNSGNKIAYTGFCGYLFDVLLLSGAANAVQCDALSKVFFTTGYMPSGSTPIQVYYPIVTGVMFTSGIISTGITGYGLGSVIIPDKDGTDITVYDAIPATGSISGTGIVYLSGTSSGVRTILTGVSEQFFYSNSYIKQYSEENLVFLSYNVLSTDIVQIYSFGDKQIDKVSVIPEPFNLNDFYLLDTFGTGSIALVFSDGLLQISGINYTLASGKIISNGYSAYHSTYNFLLYDETSGSITTSGWTGYSGQYTIGGNPTSGSARDIYLNGQKLISGFDYISSGASSIVLTGTQNSLPVVWASGIFAFPPSRTGLRQIFTGAGLGYYQNFTGTSVGTLMDEMVWLNGQRLAPDFDYKKVSSMSLLLSQNRPTGLSFEIYTGDAYFPLSVLTGKPNV